MWLDDYMVFSSRVQIKDPKSWGSDPQGPGQPASFSESPKDSKPGYWETVPLCEILLTPKSMLVHLCVNMYVCRHVHAAAAAAKSLQSCPTLCDPIDGSPSGSSVPEILQARTLEWVPMCIHVHIYKCGKVVCIHISMCVYVYVCALSSQHKIINCVIISTGIFIQP